MNPRSASGLTRRTLFLGSPRAPAAGCESVGLYAARVGGHGRTRRRGRAATAALLRLHEDLVAEITGLGQIVEHFSALRARGVDLDPAEAEDPADDGLPGRAVLHPVDRDDLLLPAEDAGLDRYPMVGQGVGVRSPADTSDDDPIHRHVTNAHA